MTVEGVVLSLTPPSTVTWPEQADARIAALERKVAALTAALVKLDAIVGADVVADVLADADSEVMP